MDLKPVRRGETCVEIESKSDRMEYKGDLESSEKLERGEISVDLVSREPNPEILKLFELTLLMLLLLLEL